MTPEQEITAIRMIDMWIKNNAIENKVVSSVLAIYIKEYQRVKKEIGSATGRTKERFDRIIENIANSFEQIQDEIIKQAVAAATTTASFTLAETAAILSWGGAVKNFVFADLSMAQIEALIITAKVDGKSIMEWTASAFGTPLEEMKERIAQGIVEGEGYRKMINDMAKEMRIVDRDIKRNLETIVRSYVASSSHQASQKVFGDNKRVIKAFEWQAALENGNIETGRGTCPRCMALDGQIKKKAEDFPEIPLHGRCRCGLIPVVKTWEELGISIPEEERIPRYWYERSDNKTRKILDKGLYDKNFSDFWKTKSRRWQDNAIGPTRADLIRRKKLKFEDIVDSKTGKLYTLDELSKNTGKKAMNDAWSYAHQRNKYD